MTTMDTVSPEEERIARWKEYADRYDTEFVRKRYGLRPRARRLAVRRPFPACGQLW